MVVGFSRGFMKVRLPPGTLLDYSFYECWDKIIYLIEISPNLMSYEYVYLEIVMCVGYLLKNGNLGIYTFFQLFVYYINLIEHIWIAIFN